MRFSFGISTPAIRAIFAYDSFLSSTLTLFVLGVGADDHDFAMAPNDFALVANRLNRRSDFHDCSPDLD